MFKILSVFFLIFLSFEGQASNSTTGILLKQGMQLIYSYNGSLTPAWTIGSINIGIDHAGMENCSRTEIHYNESEELELKWECVSGHMLNVYENGRWQLERPVGSHMRFEKKDQNGVLVSRYETAGFTKKIINGIEIDVLKTIIYLLSKDGIVKTRLQELYSLGVGTATEGIIEIPDSKVENRWKVVGEFKLESISSL